MTPKHLCILLLAVVAVGTAAGQSEDIPVENDNQFPPDNPAEPDSIAGDIIEGSGAGTIEDPITTNDESTPTPELEEVQGRILTDLASTGTADGEPPCPSPCVCHTEGDTFVIDCSGYELTEFPSPLDSRTTTLNVKNNKLTEIPKEVATLKKLKILNANNNSIMELAAGSISNLEELTVLNLANNRLIDFPSDLKNAFGLTKLEELDLGGNDMRTELKPELFSIFKSLRKVTLATASSQLVEDVCATLKETLETVCTGSCGEQSFECPDAPDKIEDEDLLDATLPGLIIFDPAEDDADPVIKLPPIDDTINSETQDAPQEKGTGTDDPINGDATVEPPKNVGEGSSRTNKEEVVPIKHNSMVVGVETPKDASPKSELDVKIGATTTSTTTGGVDKSVIGIIVAGMVVVVAGIAIRRNWSSIKKRFSSSPRPPNERGGGGANTNGTTPEEVPLQEKQDKSPV